MITMAMSFVYICVLLVVVFLVLCRFCVYLWLVLLLMYICVAS